LIEVRLEASLVAGFFVGSFWAWLAGFCADKDIYHGVHGGASLHGERQKVEGRKQKELLV